MWQLSDKTIDVKQSFRQITPISSHNSRKHPSHLSHFALPQVRRTRITLSHINQKQNWKPDSILTGFAGAGMAPVRPGTAAGTCGDGRAAPSQRQRVAAPSLPERRQRGSRLFSNCR